MLRDWLFRLRAHMTRRRLERDLDDEMRDHLAHQIAWHVGRGVPPEQARRQARLDLGVGIDALKEGVRDARGTRWPGDVWRDVAYAIRTLRRYPGFTIVAITSLALGLGANVVVFGLLNAVLLRPLPIRAPGEVVFVENSRGGPTQSFPNYRDFRDRATTFAGLAAFRIASMGVSRDASTEKVWGFLVTGNYFDLLGAQPRLGRLLSPTDDRMPGGSPVAVLSDAYWRTRFAADPQVVGRIVRINTRPYTVVGVLAPGFHGTERFLSPDVWLPMSMQAQVEGFSWLESRRAFNANVIGRLAPSVTVPQATADLNGIAASLARDYPDADSGLSVRLTQPGWLGDTLGVPVAAFVRGLMALVLLVLLAACANLASLLAARATDRHRELAIRLALGAGRWRVIRQLLIESLVLAVAGGTAGATLAAVCLNGLSRWRAAPELPIQMNVGIDWRVAVFAGAAMLVTGVLFGLAPARLAWRLDLAAASKGRAATIGRRRWASRDLLVVVQVTVCAVLVLSALLAARGLARAIAAPIGMRPDGVSAIGFDLAPAGYDKAKGRILHRRALDAVIAWPGVTSAAYADSLPLYLNQSTATVFPESATDFRQSAAVSANVYSVSPRYFATIGTRLLGGRDFGWNDTEGTPPVAVVNQAFARKVFGVDDPVGRRFRYGRDGQPVAIVGIVEDGKYVSLAEDPRPALFRPSPQIYSSELFLFVRTASTSTSVVANLQALLASLDPTVPVSVAGPANRLLDVAFLPARAATIALGIFGALALMLALTGVYGMASYSVSRRAREIGIRIAIGARPTEVLRAMLGRVAVLVGVGTIVGLGIASLIAPSFAALVYGTARSDATLIGTSLVAMAIVGVVAAWIPARRALAVDATVTLKAE